MQVLLDMVVVRIVVNTQLKVRIIVRENVLNRRAAELVDGLVVITDNADIDRNGCDMIKK